MSFFSDIYNSVARFFRPQEDEVEENSKSVATNRLKLVLMQDRTNLTPRILEQMRGELIDLLSRYVELDKELLDLNFEQEGNQVALMLSIPVIRAKDEDEIEAAIKEHNEAIKNANDNDVTESSVDDNNDNEGETEYVSSENIEIESEYDIEKHKNVSTPEEITGNNNKADYSESLETEEISNSEV